MKYDFTKESERRRFYKSNAWRGVNGARNKAVQRDKECIMCKAEGKVNTSEMTTLEVDHIIELEHCTYEQAIDLNNLRSLCNYHHNVRHNRFNGRTNQNKWDDEQW